MRFWNTKKHDIDPVENQCPEETGTACESTVFCSLSRRRWITIAVLTAVILLGAVLTAAALMGNEAVPTMKIELPIFTEDAPLIADAAVSYLERDLSVPMQDVIAQYKKPEERLDQGLPVILTFDVSGLPWGYRVSTIRLEVYRESEPAQPRVFLLDGSVRSLKVYHLETNTRYGYRIDLTLSDGSGVSVQGSFKTADTPRMLGIEGLVNVRDIGGWKTTDGRIIRQGLLYRGSELDGAVKSSYKITEQGIYDMQTVLGIRSDLDLRASSVNPSGTNPLGDGVEHIYYDAPMYSAIFSDSGAAVVCRVFSDLADPDKYPVYLHCTYGLDRTGTVCYLLEALLGLDEESLMREYEMSALYYSYLPSDDMNQMLENLNALPGATMQEKVEGYLLSIGVTPEKIGRIRSIFMEG